MESMGTTHIHLATLLRRIISRVEDIRRDRRYGPMTTVRIVYQQRSNNEDGDVQERREEDGIDGKRLLDKSGNLHPPQALTISRQTFSGYQFSLFFNPSNTSSLPELNTKWNEEYTIRNEESGMELKVTSGILQYIEWFGFYEVQTPSSFLLVLPLSPLLPPTLSFSFSLILIFK